MNRLSKAALGYDGSKWDRDNINFGAAAVCSPDGGGSLRGSGSLMLSQGYSRFCSCSADRPECLHIPLSYWR